MNNTKPPFGITPMSSTTVNRFMAIYKDLCPTGDDEAPIEVFAQRLGWPLDSVQTVAQWCHGAGLIDADAGMGEPIRIIEGRY